MNLELNRNVFSLFCPICLIDPLIFFYHIFVHLDFMELLLLKRVCKHWLSLLHTYFHYYLKFADFTGYEHRLKKEYLLLIIPQFMNIEEITLSQCWKAVDSESISIIGYCFRKLRYLDISHCRGVDYNGIVSISYFCTLLIELNISNCYNINDRSVFQIALGCKKLRIFHACSCYGITDNSILFLLDSCKFLQHIDLAYCLNLTNLLTLYILNGNVRSLEQVRITGCSNIGISPTNFQEFMKLGISLNVYF